MKKSGGELIERKHSNASSGWKIGPAYFAAGVRNN
jgi:hypothetical protein